MKSSLYGFGVEVLGEGVPAVSATGAPLKEPVHVITQPSPWQNFMLLICAAGSIASIWQVLKERK